MFPHMFVPFGKRERERERRERREEREKREERREEKREKREERREEKRNILMKKIITCIYLFNNWIKSLKKNEIKDNE